MNLKPNHPQVPVKLKFLDDRAKQYLPKYQSDLASGFDLHALDDTVIHVGQIILVKTGIAIQVPPGYELQVRPRSGLSLKSYLRVSNSPGTVDADYQGDISVIAFNSDFRTSDAKPIYIKAGDRIAQAVVVPVVQAVFEIVEDLDATTRGSSGFGSTGK
jgi:dUTP pyrophosphatase